MRRTMLPATFALIGVLAAGCSQPGYGPGYGYGQGQGSGYAPPAYGYGAQPAYYSQPAPNPMAQLLGAMLTPSSSGYGGNSGYYQPAPYSPYGWR